MHHPFPRFFERRFENRGRVRPAQVEAHVLCSRGWYCRSWRCSCGSPYPCGSPYHVLCSRVLLPVLRRATPRLRREHGPGLDGGPATRGRLHRRRGLGRLEGAHLGRRAQPATNAGARALELRHRCSTWGEAVEGLKALERF